MRPLIITLFIFIGFLREKDIKEPIETSNYVTEVFNNIGLSLPVCPVSAEKADYVEDEECGNTLFVQEEIRPVPLLIPTDIRCDGWRCPIKPMEGQLNNREPQLSSAIIQEFQRIMPYIEILIGDTDNGASVKGIILGVLLPEVLLYLLEFCWSRKKKAEKDRDEAPAEKKREGPQHPAQAHDNMEEEAELSRSGSKKKEEPRSIMKKKKQRRTEAHERQGSQRPKKNATLNAEEEKELNQLLQQFISQCLEGDL